MTQAKNKAASKKQKMKVVLSITSKVDGFRRCGVAHPDTETTYDPTDENYPFKEGDMDILAEEKMLIVSTKEVPVEKSDDEAGDT